MNSSDGGPLGPWDHRFTFPEELGCVPTIIGFVLFLVVLAVLRHYLLG
jgi:hypothetical protein